MATDTITSNEERLAAILADGITVGAIVYTAPTSFFSADVKPYKVLAVTDPTITPGQFPNEPGILGGGTITAHPVGEPDKVVCVARTNFVVLPVMHLPTFVVRRKVGRKVEILGWDKAGNACPEWMPDSEHARKNAMRSTGHAEAKGLGERYSPEDTTLKVERDE